MTRVAPFRILFAVFAGAVANMGSVAVAEDVQARLQTLLDGFCADYGFPGATAAISLPTADILTAATGLADREAETPMTRDSRMLAASIGKSFVAATVLALESDGLLKRSDLVSSHLGDRDWFVRLPNHATMTLRDLLRHGAGLPDHVHLPTFQAAMALRVSQGGTPLSPEDAIAFVFDAKPLFPAGSGWAYSDTGYLLLGLVIEKVTGRAYYDLVSERFLNPLGLSATSPSNGPLLRGLAAGYVAADNPFGLPPLTMDMGGRLLWDPAVEWTGGGLASTSRDLALWGHALFSGTAMAAAYLDRLHDAVPVAPDTPEILYGMGVAIHADTPRGPVYGHGGWIPGYVSSLRHYADHGVTIAFQINTDVGITDDRTHLVPVLEAALADLAISAGSRADRQ